MKISRLFIFLVLGFLPLSNVSADWVWSPEQGKFINSESETQSGAEDIFDNALDLYKEKKLDKAAEQFKIVLKQYPKSRVAPESQYRIGTICEEKGDYVEAHKAYQSLIKSYPQSQRFEEVIEREYQIGVMFLSGKKGKLLGLDIRPSLPLATEVFKKIVEAAPYGAFGDKAQFNLGMAYQKSGNWDSALEAYQALIDQYPQSTLLQQARLQLAEVSYAKSSNQTRDQSALDEASRQAQGYLKRYPGSEEAEKAEKISREVDELNAEKNYRIGLYYEKDNYVTSALIYYADTAKRYPNTSWGRKASEKMHSLQEPVKYLNAQAGELSKELEALEAKYQTLGAGQKAERSQIAKEIAQMKKRIKSVEKSKVESLDRRRQDLKRRERELNEKFKELERKKKRFKDNTSPEFQKAIDRWQKSLEAERDALAEEKGRLDSWRSELGIPEEKFYENLIPDHLIPFGGKSETPLQKIQQLDDKDLYKLSKKKKELLGKKEKLYKRHSELNALLVPERSETGLKRKRLRGAVKRDATKPTDPKLVARENDIEALEAKLKAKMADYEKFFGKSAEQELEALLDSRTASQASFNPFPPEKGDPHQKTLEELLELKMHLKEQVRVQQDIVQTLSTAFDKELAMKEQQEMIKSVEEHQKVDVRDLRKKIKGVEKSIRKSYEDIQDRQKKKGVLLEELDQALHPQDEKTGVLKTLAKPITGPAYLAKAFIFGLPNEDVVLTDAAKKPESSARAKKIEQDIELESLMIQAQAEEIAKFEKQLEVLNAQASLAGGLKFRSSFVKVPYTFIDEAVQSARRVVPRKSRKDVLLNRLDHQTIELKRFQSELESTEAAIKEKTPAVPTAVATSESSKPEKEAGQIPDERQLREDVMNLQEQLEISYSIYAQEQAVVLGTPIEAEAPQDVEGAKQYAEFRKVGAEISGLIDEELRIEQQEVSILEMRIQEADKVNPTVTSIAMQEDIETEKTRIQKRLTDLATRHDFLTKEKERFKV